MQVHTPEDQLLSSLEGETDREREIPGGGVRLLYQPICIQSHRGGVSSLLCSTYSPPPPPQIQHVYLALRERPDSRADPALRGESSVAHHADICSVPGNVFMPDSHRVQCGCSSAPAWFESSQCQDEELKKTVLAVVQCMSQRSGDILSCHIIYSTKSELFLRFR